MERLGAWFTRRYLDPTSLRVFSCAAIGFAVLSLAISFVTVEGGRTAFGTDLGADYSGFYAAGAILNERPPKEIYDPAVQDQFQRRFLPGRPAEESLPYVHPPFVALLFRPLAYLPYHWSVFAWTVISAGVYVTGLAVVRGLVWHIPCRAQGTALLLALSFQPFLIDCWLGGQLSAFGFLFVALALRADARGRPVAAGFAYGLCLYKPPLLVLIVPMLVVGRRWQTLSGLAACGALLGGVSVAAVGSEVCEGFVRTLLGFAAANNEGRGVFRDWKYVDLNSFLKLLVGGYGPTAVRFGLLVVAAGFAPLLLRVWWQAGRATDQTRRLVAAGTVGLTPCLNLYVANYDSILVVLSVLLTLDVLYGLRSGPTDQLPSGYKWLLVLLWVVPWVSQVLARETGFQAFTLVLAAVGLYPLTLARQVWRGTGTEPVPGGRG
jgi:hypothetical protein